MKKIGIGSYKAEERAGRLNDSEMRFAREIAELSKSLIWVTVPMQGAELAAAGGGHRQAEAQRTNEPCK